MNPIKENRKFGVILIEHKVRPVPMTIDRFPTVSLSIPSRYPALLFASGTGGTNAFSDGEFVY